jgi:hypothetical protein
LAAFRHIETAKWVLQYYPAEMDEMQSEDLPMVDVFGTLGRRFDSDFVEESWQK